MRLDNVSQDAVNSFWQRCGEIEPFPRSLERSVALALPIAVVKLPHLGLRNVEIWLQRRGVGFHFSCQSRAVRGSLVAFGGNGFIFIDGADPEDERRFTLAHEIAHFLIDYWHPREKAINWFGREVAEVLDGFRPLGMTERIHALLAGTPIGVHTNLMERSEASSMSNSEVWKIEDRADTIALALLAPPDEVLSRSDLTLAQFEQRRFAMKTVLCNYFGLPAPVANAYSWSLLVTIGKGPSWVESFRLK